MVLGSTVRAWVMRCSKRSLPKLVVLERGFGLVEASCDGVEGIVPLTAFGPLSCVRFWSYHCTRLVMREFAII